MQVAGIRGVERTSFVDVRRGLFALRYADAPGAEAPIVSFAPAQGSEGLLVFLPCPGCPATTLERPGQLVVLSSQGNARLQIAVTPRRPGGSVESRLELEPLDRVATAPGSVLSANNNRSDADAYGLGTDRSGCDASPEDENGARSAAELSGKMDIGLVGHVSRLGDVSVGAGEWLAGPAAPRPIEGFFLKTAEFAATWIEAQSLVAGDAAWTDWRPANLFQGTKGRARPLIGVRLRVTAAAPVGLQLRASALFLGSPVMSRLGRAIEFRSAAGGDPLVGLCVDEFEAPRTVEFAGLKMPAKGKVRVFRAGAERAVL